MTRPLLLDLFCGAGGAAVGYDRAGFTVVGVDVKPQPHYPFAFHQMDALFVLTHHQALDDFAVIHASPPCQAYVRSGMVAKDGRHPKLIEPVRAALIATGLPYVIENVPGSPMRSDLILCGSMFGLAVRRHRWFESNAQPVALHAVVRPLAADHRRLRTSARQGRRVAKWETADATL